jgi:hypothetical protein
MNASRKRFSLVAGTVAIVLTCAAMAFFYGRTATTGLGAVDTDIAFTIAQDSTPAGLTPGGSVQGLDFTVTNFRETAVSITEVIITVASTSNAGCTAADFAVTQPSKPSVATPVLIAGISSKAFTSGAGAEHGSTGATLQMIDRAVNQDLCKNVTVILAYTVRYTVG